MHRPLIFKLWSNEPPDPKDISWIEEEPGEVPKEGKA